MPKVFLTLGRTGDLILQLPFLKHLRDSTEEKPVVVVSRQYAPVLEGVSYVDADILDVDWYDGFQQAHAYAQSKYGEVCVTQCHAPNMTNGRLCATFGQAIWVDAGFPDSYGKFPTVFDRRNNAREERLMSRFQQSKPLLLYNFTGISSPFPHTRTIYGLLTRCSRDFSLIDIGKVHAERIFDLLALYDAAAGLITIDTATLHLAAASKVPMLAYTVDGWNSAVPQGDNCRMKIPYSHAIRQLNAVRDFVNSLPRENKMPPNLLTKVKPPRDIVVRRTAAIGDVLCSTVVAARLKELGYRPIFQCHNDIHCVLRRCPDVAEVRPCNTPTMVNLDGAYEKHGGRKQLHFHDMFYRSATMQLQRQRIDLGQPYNCRPKLILHPDEVTQDRAQFEKHSRPWIFIVPRSDSFNVRTYPDYAWTQAAEKMVGTKFWLGRHNAPPGPFVDLQCRHLDNLIVWIAKADLVVTVDTGPMHVAAALGVPVIALTQSSRPELHLNDQNDFQTIEPKLDCLGCMEHICPKNRNVPPCWNISPDIIAQAVNYRIAAQSNDWISAIVPIYQPNVQVLNRCLACLLPQVNEIIVAAEAKSVIPLGIMQNPKIRVAKTKRSGIGFSGNANLGARSSVGKWLLFCNDDAFLDDGAVQKMRDVTKPDTGIVSNLLRYPDGTIYHAGKVRSPGMRGWGHIDHKHRDHTFRDVTELENCCGCVVLTPRKVFYDAGCYDEEMKIFAQDDAYALSVRKLGYRILFTPFSTGTHQEHASVSKLGNIGAYVQDANRVFERKFGRYFTHNINRVPGNFDYLKQ